MRNQQTITFKQAFAFLASCLGLVLGSTTFAQDRPEKLPATYRYIGSYQLNSKLRVENGVSAPVVISPLVYRVFSDGMEVRVYVRSSDEDSYTAYDIYRTDGIGVSKASGEIEVVAGVQGYSTKGEMLRQISVTRNSLTMVKTPPRSHRVIITRARAISTSSAPSATDKK
ncbi:hypothetical protein NT6N_35450 [Oceaniferula spumae]|uniref:Uncharacterized protein n=1 Tax=Oceaniferula spumae TaxID=2979115 RepID=A0AAT9FR70_9BACT